MRCWKEEGQEGISMEKPHKRRLSAFDVTLASSQRVTTRRDTSLCNLRPFFYTCCLNETHSTSSLKGLCGLTETLVNCRDSPGNSDTPKDQSRCVCVCVCKINGLFKQDSYHFEKLSFYNSFFLCSKDHFKITFSKSSSVKAFGSEM